MAVITVNIMKTLYNFLNAETLAFIEEEVEGLKTRTCWVPSNDTWDPRIRAGITGTVISTYVSDQVVNIIGQTLLPHVPAVNKITAQHYLWYPNSGISYHSDRKRDEYIFGATIYLTKEWDINWGGLFVHGNTDKDDYKDLKVKYPFYNSVNINTNFIWHAVTTVSPLAPHPRHTIQIWGKP